MNWKKAILVGLIAFVITLPLSWFVLEDYLYWIFPPSAYRDTRITLVLIPLIFSSLIGVAWSIKPPKGELPISSWVNALLGMALFLIFSCGFHIWIIGQGEQAALAFLVTIPLTLVVFPFSALGGVLGAWIAFRFRKTKASKAVVIIGASVGGILVIILSAILFYIAFS